MNKIKKQNCLVEFGDIFLQNTFQLFEITAALHKISVALGIAYYDIIQTVRSFHNYILILLTV